MERINKYIVIKREDIDQYLGPAGASRFYSWVASTNKCRAADGKEAREYWVISNSCPYYDDAGEIVEAWAEGKPLQKHVLAKELQEAKAQIALLETMNKESLLLSAALLRDFSDLRAQAIKLAGYMKSIMLRLVYTRSNKHGEILYIPKKAGLSSSEEGHSWACIEYCSDPTPTHYTRALNRITPLDSLVVPTTTILDTESLAADFDKTYARQTSNRSSSE